MRSWFSAWALQKDSFDQVASSSNVRRIRSLPITITFEHRLSPCYVNKPVKYNQYYLRFV
jgi:hypothetical protein